MSFLIKNGYVVTMNPEREVFDGGFVAVEDSRIEAVGPASALPGKTYDETLDASGMIVLPGLINMHQHHWYNLFKGLCDGMLLEPWVFLRAAHQPPPDGGRPAASTPGAYPPPDESPSTENELPMSPQVKTAKGRNSKTAGFSLKRRAVELLNQRADHMNRMAQHIWERPELGLEERHAAHWPGLHQVIPLRLLAPSTLPCCISPGLCHGEEKVGALSAFQDETEESGEQRHCSTR